MFSTFYNAKLIFAEFMRIVNSIAGFIHIPQKLDFYAHIC